MRNLSVSPSISVSLSLPRTPLSYYSPVGKTKYATEVHTQELSGRSQIDCLHLFCYAQLNRLLSLRCAAKSTAFASGATLQQKLYGCKEHGIIHLNHGTASATSELKEEEAFASSAIRHCSRT